MNGVDTNILIIVVEEQRIFHEREKGKGELDPEFPFLTKLSTLINNLSQ